MPLPLRWRSRLERWRDRLRGLFAAEPRAPRPRLCPSCGTLVGSSATKCHECGASIRFSLAAVSRSLDGLLPATTTPVTFTVLGLNFLLFGVSLLASLQAGTGFSLMGGIRLEVLDRLGALQPILVWHGELWRLVMPIFLHGGLLHLAMNSIVLMDVGPQVEEVYGSARYLFLYVVTGIFGFVASMTWMILTRGGFGWSVGASGSLMGLIGLILALTTRRGGAVMQMIRTQMIRWVIYIFILGVFFRADNAAHFGGLASGFLLGRIVADREPATHAERQRAYAMGWLGGLVVVASFGAMLLRYFRAG